MKPLNELTKYSSRSSHWSYYGNIAYYPGLDHIKASLSTLRVTHLWVRNLLRAPRGWRSCDRRLEPPGHPGLTHSHVWQLLGGGISSPPRGLFESSHTLGLGSGLRAHREVKVACGACVT